MPTPMQVPARAIELMTRLAETSDGLIDRLVGSKDQQVRTPGALADYLARAFGEDWSEREVRALIRELFSMVITADHHGQDMAVAAEQVAASQELKLDVDQRSTLESTLRALLTRPQVANMARAVSVLGENDKLFHSVRGASEVRPVVALDGVSTAGAVVTRRLRFSYFEDNELQEVDVVVDSHDLELIRQALDRLTADVTRATDLVKAAGVDLFRIDDEDDEDGE